MDVGCKIRRKSEFDRANLFQKWIFLWMLRLFRLGAKKELQFDDLTRCAANDEPQVVTELLQVEWKKELVKLSQDEKYQPSLTRAIIRAFGKRYILANVILVASELSRLAQPFMIGAIILYLQKRSNVTREDAVGAACAFVLSTMLFVFLRHFGKVTAMRVGNNVRTAISLMIFRKVLRVSTSSLVDMNIGQIMNVLANDLTRFEDLSWYLPFLLCAPFMIIFVLIFTLIYLGEACVGGLVVLLVFILLQAFVGNLFKSFRHKTARVTDQRIKLMAELISAIKLIKLYTWEEPFEERVQKIRKNEIVHFRKTFVLKGINNALYFVTTRLMLFFTYLIYVLRGYTLNSFATFVTMSLYDAIRLTVTRWTPKAIAIGAESLAACGRIEKILLLPEKSTRADGCANEILSDRSSLSKRSESISLDNLSARWTRKLQKDNLHDLSLSINQGELIILIGSVGSGKSCFLNALLNEIEITSGKMQIRGELSYAPQEPWCFGGTVKENVLCSSKFHPERYQKVIEACCLKRDIRMLPLGDDTFVGERGYQLSGGQKARLSLARAIYRESQIYLLDDPLSAVDAKVANHIFNKCIRQFLKDKTVILVTHQLQFLPWADRIVLMEDGHITSCAPYSEIMDRGVEIASLVRSNSVAQEELSEEKASRSRRVSSSSDGLKSCELVEENSKERVTEKTSNGYSEKKSPLAREEKSASGKISFKIYWKYLTCGKNCSFLLLSLFAALISQAIYQLNDVWLAAWTDSEESKSLAANETKPSIASSLILPNLSDNTGLYCGLTLILFIFGFLRAFFIFLLCLSSSIALHNSLFQKLLRAPLFFYNVNAVGRILNRVTGDIGTIDQTIPDLLIELVSFFMQVAGIVALTIVKQPLLIVVVILLTLIAIPVRLMYIQTARDIQRLDSLSKSPVYSYMSTILSSLVTVRSFKIADKLENNFKGLLGDTISTKFHVLCADRSIGFILDNITTLYITAVTLVVMIQTNISPSDAGLILASSLQLSGIFQSAVKSSADLETKMISCERVFEYIAIEPEAPLDIPEIDSKLTSWPKDGFIQFRSVDLQYSEQLEKVLKGVTFDVQSGSKVAIVGRTGAGKSSLLTVLFRLYELNNSSNNNTQVPAGIFIDNVDIKSLGLRHLRSRLSIIPQEPILFSGTIRSNLDPFNKYSDDELWQALDSSHLKAAVNEMPGQLSALVTEGGSNLSLGQRQLLCLSRALLKKNKILVCDEATANVDKETDNIIQQTIKNNFQTCTVLTIAHRLNTIIDMDKVLVMDEGRIVEYDEPYNLLKENSTSLFASMVRQTGPDHERVLVESAKLAHLQRQEQANKSE